MADSHGHDDGSHTLHECLSQEDGEDLALKLVRPVRTLLTWIWRLLRPPLRLLLHIVMLPVDLVFLFVDAFSVNIRKTGLFHLDCRGRDSYAGGICPPARKYTNKYLFKLICPEMGRSRAERRTVCRAGERPAIRFVRGTVWIAVLAGLGLLTGWTVQAMWSKWPGRPATEQAVKEIVAERLSRAEAAYGQGRYDEALSLYKSALRLDPASKATLYKVGLCYDELKVPDGALRFFAAAAEGENAHPPAARRMALNLYARGEIQAAGRHAQQAIGLGITDGSMHAIAGDACLWAKDAAGAETHITAALEANPDSSTVKLAQAHLLSSKQESEKALAILDSVLGDPSVALLAGLYKLDLLRLAGRANDALTHVESLAARFPDLPRLSMLLVETQFATGQRAAAIQEAQRLREQYRDRPGAKLELAATLSRNGQDSLALEMAQDCAGDSQFSAPANVFMGEVFLRRGIPEHAVAYAQKALESRPNYAAGLLLAGRAALMAGDLEKAGVYLNGAIEQVPKDPTVWHSLGMLHLAVGDIGAAEESLQKACELDPANGQLHQDYGMVLFNVGRKDPAKLEQAKAELLKAVDLMQHAMTAYTSLAMLARQGGDSQAARNYYLQAIQADPRQAAIAANNLAELLMSEDKDGKNAPTALALAYSAYVRARGTGYEGPITDTLKKALTAAGVPAEALGIVLPAEDQAPPQPKVEQAPLEPKSVGTAAGAPAGKAGL